MTNCGCGTDITFPFHQLACIDCGAGCCLTCAVQLESATYCEQCARSLLEAVPVRPPGWFVLY